MRRLLLYLDWVIVVGGVGRNGCGADAGADAELTMEKHGWVSRMLHYQVDD